MKEWWSTDPLDRDCRELYQRTLSCLSTHGVSTAGGYHPVVAYFGMDMWISCSARRVQVRIKTGGQYQLALQCDGQGRRERYTPYLVTLCIETLRQLQVQDDIANV